jgi:hypothetical protein
MRRLPKMRASTEYAPGPRSARIPLFRIETAKWKESLPLVQWPANNSKMIIRIEEYGVKTPINTVITILALRTSAQGEFTSVQCAVPSFRNAAATTNRSSRSAMPGSPVGNIENSLCTTERVIFPGDAANLQSRIAQLFFRRGIHPPRLPYSNVLKRDTSCLP